MPRNIRWTEECSEDEDCWFCSGEACNLCGPPSGRPDCEHDSYERHCSWVTGATLREGGPDA